MSRKVVPGDGQRDADACLAVELPVSRGGQQRKEGEQQTEDPHQQAGHERRARAEVQLAEREAQHQEAVHGDETDDQGRHLTGQHGQKPGHLARCTVSPGAVLPQVRPQVHAVRHPDHCQVQAHQKVRQTQVGDEHVKTQSDLAFDRSHDHTGQVSHQRHDGEPGQKAAVNVGTQQSFTGRDLVRRGVAVE